MDYVYVGRVANTHGVRGGVKVFPTTDDPNRFKQLKTITLEDLKGQDKDYKITNVKFAGKFVVLQLEGIDTIDSALLLKQQIVKVPRTEALPLEDDEYYVQDLIGIAVEDDTGRHKGIIKDVMFTGNNEVYVIDLDDGQELLLPAIKACILHVDMEQKKMDIHILEGLL